jgi:CheY-like chemotaxis protein
VKKILIVEDNKDSSEIIGLFITRIGHHPIKAKNSKEAITLAEAEEPDLIFMDMELLDVDGVKTTAYLDRIPKHLTFLVVAITAWVSALWQEKAEKVGIVTYLIKPISPPVLKETIEEYTRSSLTQKF